MDIPIDDHILQQLKANPLKGWSLLVHHYGGHVYGVALRMLGHEKDAEDITQEVWLIISKKIDSFRGDAKLSTWLYRITVNKCLEKIRTRKRDKSIYIEDYLPKFCSKGSSQQSEIDWSQNPQIRLDNKWLREDIFKAIYKLPVEYREVIILRDLEGVSGLDTANLLDLSLAAVKTRLHRARAAVRGQLTSKYGKKPWFAFLNWKGAKS